MQLQHKIWQGKNGRWFSYVYYANGKRKLLSKKTEQELFSAIEKHNKRTVKSNSNILEMSNQDVIGNEAELNNLKKELKNYFDVNKISDIPLYKVFCGMRERCYCSTAENYGSYGAKGVKICDEWMNSFDGKLKFIIWAVQNGYEEGLSIDRIDPNGNYCPDNCRWIPLSEQADNKRNTKKYLINGENLTMSEISQKYNIPFRKLYWKIVENGISVEQAITEK